LAITNAVVGDFRLAKNGTVATLSGATVTHDANGYYLIALTTGNTDTTGRLVLTSGNAAHSMASHHWSVLPASVFDAIYTNATNSTGGLVTATGSITALAGAIATTTNITQASGVTLAATTHTGATIPTVTSVTNGVIVTTNNDKTGYTATVSDKTGFKLASDGLAQVTSWTVAITGNITGNMTGSVGSISGVTFPTYFGSLGINSSGHISRVVLVDTTTTNTDMRGTDGAALASSWTATRAGYLDGVLIAANYNQRTVSVTGSNHVAADIHESQANSIHETTFDTDAMSARVIASDAATEIANSVAATQALARLDSMIESDGAGQFRFDTIALSMAPAGGGGGGTDWTANERTAIRSILGIPTSGTTPTDPTEGILDQIRDQTALIQAGGTVTVSTPVTASGQLASPLIIGDDYLNANGRAFSWTVALPSGFVAATASCKFGMRYEDDQGVNSFIQSGTVIDAGSGNVTLRFDVAKSVTGLLRPGWYDWSVEIASASGTEITRVKSGKNAEWQEKQT
jgi:phosphohistidine swiveling domain-containing protein